MGQMNRQESKGDVLKVSDSVLHVVWCLWFLLNRVGGPGGGFGHLASECRDSLSQEVPLLHHILKLLCELCMELSKR